MIIKFEVSSCTIILIYENRLMRTSLKNVTVVSLRMEKFYAKLACVSRSYQHFTVYRTANIASYFGGFRMSMATGNVDFYTYARFY